MNFAIYLVNSEGRRAPDPAERYDDKNEAFTLDSVCAWGRLHYTRFVVLDDKKVQHYASDERESNGAYPPYGEY